MLYWAVIDSERRAWEVDKETKIENAHGRTMNRYSLLETRSVKYFRCARKNRFTILSHPMAAGCPLGSIVQCSLSAYIAKIY